MAITAIESAYQVVVATPGKKFHVPALHGELLERAIREQCGLALDGKKYIWSMQVTLAPRPVRSVIRGSRAKGPPADHIREARLREQGRQVR